MLKFFLYLTSFFFYFFFFIFFFFFLNLCIIFANCSSNILIPLSSGAPDFFIIFFNLISPIGLSFMMIIAFNFDDWYLIFLYFNFFNLSSIIFHKRIFEESLFSS